MDEKPSERLVDQRIRNRIMEVLEPLAEGDAGVRSFGIGEYVNEFFDWVSDLSPLWRENSALTADEVARLEHVQRLLLDACKATAVDCSDDEFISSGWPAKIAPDASATLDLMRQRGRFSEVVEESEPLT